MEAGYMVAGQAAGAANMLAAKSGHAAQKSAVRIHPYGTKSVGKF
jgi:hypothetical protein